MSPIQLVQRLDWWVLYCKPTYHTRVLSSKAHVIFELFQNVALLKTLDVDCVAPPMVVKAVASVQVSPPLTLEPPNLHILPLAPKIQPTKMLNVTPLPNVVETLGTILGTNLWSIASPIVLTPKLEKTLVHTKNNKHKHSKHQKVVQVFSSSNLDESSKSDEEQLALAIKPKRKHLKWKYGSLLERKKSSKVRSKLKKHVQHLSSSNNSRSNES